MPLANLVPNVDYRLSLVPYNGDGPGFSCHCVACGRDIPNDNVLVSYDPMTLCYRVLAMCHHMSEMRRVTREELMYPIGTLVLDFFPRLEYRSSPGEWDGVLVTPRIVEAVMTPRQKKTPPKRKGRLLTL